MDTAVRVGAVTYLNTKPLIYELEVLAPNAELILDVPSRLADQLAAGELDVALIPVIEYFRAEAPEVVEQWKGLVAAGAPTPVVDGQNPAEPSPGRRRRRRRRRRFRPVPQ